jgi:RNA polymerase sigma-70 factor (ECF subfamily)
MMIGNQLTMDPAPSVPPNVTHAADWRLAQLAQGQHPSAWIELVRGTEGIVMGLLVRHVQAQEREDLFQEVFLRIHRHLGSYRGESALGTWAFQVAMNVIRSHWAAQQRRRSREVLATDWSPPRPDGEEEVWDVPVAAEQDEVLAAAEQQSLLRTLRGLIADLKPLDRQVLFLRDVDGCSYEEISARLQVPMGTVKSRLARARANLAAVLAGRNPAAAKFSPNRLH